MAPVFLNVFGLTMVLKLCWRHITAIKAWLIHLEIRKRIWGWIGHTLRRSSSNVTKQALDWNPQGKRKVGRPNLTWRRSADAEVKPIGTTWVELKRASQNRVRWMSVVMALCSLVKQTSIHLTSCQNVSRIEHTSTSVYVAFWLVLRFRESKQFI